MNLNKRVKRTFPEASNTRERSAKPFKRSINTTCLPDRKSM